MRLNAIEKLIIKYTEEYIDAVGVTPTRINLTLDVGRMLTLLGKRYGACNVDLRDNTLVGYKTPYGYLEADFIAGDTTILVEAT